jgi:hypothetical protein
MSTSARTLPATRASTAQTASALLTVMMSMNVRRWLHHVMNFRDA